MLCISVAGAVIALAASSFTLSWTHSVEQTRWQETWQVTEQGLLLVSARVQGSGAGISVPENAVWSEEGWTYTPSLPPLPSLSLAASGQTGEGWTLCTEDQCLSLGEVAGQTTMLSAQPQCAD